MSPHTCPRPAVELRHRKIGAGLPQDLVGLAQLAVLSFQRLDALALVRGRPGPQTLVALGLSDPLAQRLARAANLGCNRLDRGPLRAVLARMVPDHPDRPLADLRGKGGRVLRHGSILSRVGASAKPGAVQPPGCPVVAGPIARPRAALVGARSTSAGRSAFACSPGDAGRA